MSGTAKSTRIMDILERETGGHSYKSHKYSLYESERSAVEYGEADATIQWKRISKYPLAFIIDFVYVNGTGEGYFKWLNT